MSSAPSTPAARRRLTRGLVLAATVGASTLLPAVAASADATATVTGEVVQAWAEAGPGPAAAGRQAEGPVTWIQPAEGEAVRVDGGGVEGMAPGSIVSVTLHDDGGDDGDGGSDTDAGGSDGDGGNVVDATLLESAPPAPALSDPSGLTNEVTVVLVRPGGVRADTVTESQVVDAVTGPVADYWSEQTGDAVRIGVTDSRDWMVTTADCSDATALWNEVAAEVGFVEGPHKHLLLYVSSAAPGCSYALAEVGVGPATGGRLYVTELEPSSIAHELGHNFGLGHSSALQCEGAVETGNCHTAGYRDYYDVMGASWHELGSLNAPQAALLGVLPAAQQQSLTVSDGPTTVTLAPMAGRSGTRALRLTDAAGVEYWLEYRTATMRDEWLASDNPYHLEQGVLLRRAGAMPDTSVLLDGTPSTSAGWSGDFQAALQVGTAVAVSDGDFSVVVQGLTPAGVVLTVTPSPPAAAAPVPPPPASVPSGTLLAGQARAAATPAVPTEGTVVAEVAPRGVSPVGRTPLLEAAATGDQGMGALVAMAGALVAGSTLLVVRTARRSGALRR